MESAFDLKSTRLSALSVHLFTPDVAVIRAHLTNKAQTYQMFANTPFILDVSALNVSQSFDVLSALQVFQEHGLHVIALRHQKQDASRWAKEAGLIFLSVKQEPIVLTETTLPEIKSENASQVNNDTLPAMEDLSKVESEMLVSDEASKENVLPEIEKSDTSNNDTPTETTLPENIESTTPVDGVAVVTELAARPTLVITTPVRTGQQIYAEKADLIVLCMVSEGAELIADGNIHVYAPMRGRALAGESGDKNARIFVQSMQAELVSIAGIYRVFEQNLPPSLHKHAVQIELHDEKLSIMAINAQ